MREIPFTAQRAPHTRTDPDYAPEAEVFDNLTHREIHDGVQQLDPAALSAGSQTWQGSATGVADAVSQAHTEIRSLIADGWRGGAADQAAQAVRAFEADGQRLADVMSTVAQRLGQAGDAAESLRAAVATPSEDRPDLSAALLDPSQATANTATQKSVEHARQDAVAAMDGIYTGAFLRSGAGVPAFPDIAEGGADPVAAATPTGSPVTAPVSVSDPGVPVAQPVTFSTPGHDVESSVAHNDSLPEEKAADTTATAASAPVASGRVAPIGIETTPAASAQTVAATTSPATAPTAAVAPPAARPVASAPAARVDPAASAPIGAPAVSGGGTHHTTEDERKREDRRRDSNSDAAVSGAGAGAFGGLMGGALAAADTTRPGSGLGPAPVARPPQDDEDEDDLHWFDDDELTFLEPADEPDDLIGALDPTTPPVVGEWTDLE